MLMIEEMVSFKLTRSVVLHFNKIPSNGVYLTNKSLISKKGLINSLQSGFLFRTTERHSPTEYFSNESPTPLRGGKQKR